MQSNDYDVTIVGGGIVGLACALGLAVDNFRIALLEAQPQPMQTFPQDTDCFDSKVVAITRASEYLFQRLGVWSDIQSSRLCAYQHMKVWDNVMDGLIEFSAMDFFEDNLGYIIEQRVILAALWQKLQQHANVSIFTGTKIVSLHHHNNEVEVFLSNNTSIKSRCVIGADGANSMVRELCKIGTTGWDYQQSAIVATVEGSLSHHDTAFQRFAPQGPLALLPLAQPLISSIVWTSSTDQAYNLMQTTNQDFANQLQREMNAVMGEMKLVGERFLFPLKTHHAKQYAIARIALIGDAAHTLHPLAGQGVNAGLLDVASIVEILTQAKENKRDFGALSVLKKFDRQRRVHNQMMIWTMELFKQGFGSTIPLVQRIRNSGLNWVNGQSSIKHLLAKMALGTLGPIPTLAKKISEGNSHVKNHAII